LHGQFEIHYVSGIDPRHGDGAVVCPRMLGIVHPNDTVQGDVLDATLSILPLLVRSIPSIVLDVLVSARRIRSGRK
jgi:hypothetical protein